MRFDNDFNTSSGPDVQVFLSETTTTDGALLIEDKRTEDGIDHFSGAITFNLPGEVMIGDYDYVASNVSWAFGAFGDKVYYGLMLYQIIL